jgi:hypothetical protein
MGYAIAPCILHHLTIGEGLAFKGPHHKKTMDQAFHRGTGIISANNVLGWSMAAQASRIAISLDRAPERCSSMRRPWRARRAFSIAAFISAHRDRSVLFHPCGKLRPN